MRKYPWAVLAVCISIWGRLDSARSQAPAGTAFSYQAQIKMSGRPLNGPTDFAFGLFDAPEGGNLVAEQLNVFGVDVVNGRFAVSLDFGPDAFDGSARWIAIAVRFPAGAANQGTLLSPRQPITPVPYALRALEGSGGAGDGHSLDAADGDPTDAVFVDANGRVGLGTTAPVARQHVRAGQIGVSPDHVANDDLIIEGTDAVLGIYSANQGGAGSAIALKEMDQGQFTNSWGIVRESSGGGGGLRFVFGNTPNQFQHAAILYLAPNGRTGIGTDNPSSRLSVNGTIEALAGGIRFPDGTVQTTAATGGNSGNGGAAWSLFGNAGTDPATNFLGTVDDTALEIRVHGQRALRIEPDPDAPNLVGGSHANAVAEVPSGAMQVRGATIGGGGLPEAPNQVVREFGTVGGGLGNTAGRWVTIGGGRDNSATGFYATIAGGHMNSAGSQAAVSGGLMNNANAVNASITGGLLNTVSGANATVAGGSQNTASGSQAIVAGGLENAAAGTNAIVAGGTQNEAAGDFSFAAGYGAKVRQADRGTFVWSDFTGALPGGTDFTSTAENQFLVRATGGVGINTKAPQGALHTQAADDDTPDLVLGGNGENDDNGLITSDPNLPSSDINLFSNGNLGIKLDSNDDESNARFIIADGDETPVFIVEENGDTNVVDLDATGVVTADSLEAEDDLGATDTPAAGGVYRDNVVYAWAHVRADGSVTSSYGCTVNKLLGTGSFRVSFNRQLRNGASAVVTPQTVNDPVIATVVTNQNQADVATKVFDGRAFVGADYGFYIQVVGRP